MQVYISATFTSLMHTTSKPHYRYCAPELLSTAKKKLMTAEHSLVIVAMVVSLAISVLLSSSIATIASLWLPRWSWDDKMSKWLPSFSYMQHLKVNFHNSASYFWNLISKVRFVLPALFILKMLQIKHLAHNRHYLSPVALLHLTWQHLTAPPVGPSPTDTAVGGWQPPGLSPSSPPPPSHHLSTLRSSGWHWWGSGDTWFHTLVELV